MFDMIMEPFACVRPPIVHTVIPYPRKLFGNRPNLKQINGVVVDVMRTVAPAMLIESEVVGEN
jgi:hypothetical protein